MPGPGGVGLSEGGPSRVWYGLAAAVIVIGLATGVVLVFSTVKDVVRPVSRFTTGSAVEADLRAGANRTIYTGSTPDGPVSGSLRCAVADVATGAEVATSPAGAVTLTLGSDEYQSLAHFRVERDGRYRVTCSEAAGRTVPMAVGPRLRVFRSVGRVFAAAAAVLLAVAVGAALIAVTAVKRHQHRRSTVPR